MAAAQMKVADTPVTLRTKRPFVAAVGRQWKCAGEIGLSCTVARLELGINSAVGAEQCAVDVNFLAGNRGHDGRTITGRGSTDLGCAHR